MLILPMGHEQSDCGASMRATTASKMRALRAIAAVILLSTTVSLRGSVAAAPPGVAEYAVWGTDLQNGVHPESAPSGVRFVDVSNGSGHSLAVDDQGGVWARGYNRAGQLGNGAVAASELAPTVTWEPVTILPADTKITAVAASNVSGGYGFSVALDADGTVWSWGQNDSGQLGNGLDGAYYPATPVTPVQVDLGVAIVQISAGDSHTMALDATGHAWGWGNNGSGQIGSANNLYSTLGAPPHVVSSVADLVQVSAGGQFSEVLDQHGHIWGFGYAQGGALGTYPSGGANWDPVAPDGTAGVVFTQVATGEGFTVALESDGSVWSWGRALEGQLGRGVNPPTTMEPAMITAADGGGSLPPMLAIEAGDSQVVALDGQGQLWGWGRTDLLDDGGTGVAVAFVPRLADLNELPSGTKFAVVDTGNRFGTAMPAFFQAADPPDGEVGTGYATYQFDAVGLGAVTFTVASGALPDGLALAADGALAGSPTVAGRFQFSIIATDEAGGVVTTDQLTIVIAGRVPVPPTLVNASPPAGGTVGAAYVPYTFTATGDSIITFDVSAGDLPDGLGLDADTGVLTGVPIVAGRFDFTVRASNGAGTDEQALTITIAPVPVPPTLVNTSPPTDGTVGLAFGPYTFTATGDSIITFDVSAGDLPDGLGLDADTGVLTGVPAVAGRFDFTVRASNGAGTDEQALTITIAPEPVPLADLSVSITQANSVLLGNTAVTTVTITNLGPDPAVDVTLDVTLGRLRLGVTLPAGCASLSPDLSGDLMVQCSIAGLAPNGLSAFTFGGRAAPNSGSCTIFGTSGNDTIAGTAGADVICGLGGTDTIDGKTGDDTIYGDVPPGVAPYVIASSAAVGAATLDLDAANNTASATTSVALGTPARDVIAGGKGNDTIWGQEGHDRLDGDAGDDRIRGGLGNDTVSGGAGRDVISGNEGNDVLAGNGEADDIAGGEGDDTIYGGAGDDRMGGGDGNDSIHGEAGNDVLHGGANAPPALNLLNGGPGTDCASNGPDIRVKIEREAPC